MPLWDKKSLEIADNIYPTRKDIKYCQARACVQTIIYQMGGIVRDTLD